MNTKQSNALFLLALFSVALLFILIYLVPNILAEKTTQSSQTTCPDPGLASQPVDSDSKGLVILVNSSCLKEKSFHATDIITNYNTTSTAMGNNLLFQVTSSTFIILLFPLLLMALFKYKSRANSVIPSRVSNITILYLSFILAVSFYVGAQYCKDLISSFRKYLNQSQNEYGVIRTLYPGRLFIYVIVIACIMGFVDYVLPSPPPPIIGYNTDGNLILSNYPNLNSPIGKNSPTKTQNRNLNLNPTSPQLNGNILPPGEPRPPNNGPDAINNNPIDISQRLPINNGDLIRQPINLGGYVPPNPMDPKPTGLYNLGNSCFVASILQILFMTPPFRDMILNSQIDLELGDTLATNPRHLLDVLRDLFMFLSVGEVAIVPIAFINALREFRPFWFMGLALIQQDAHEFLFALFNYLEDPQLGLSDAIHDLFQFTLFVPAPVEMRAFILPQPQLMLHLSIPVSYTTDENGHIFIRDLVEAIDEHFRRSGQSIQNPPKYFIPQLHIFEAVPTLVPVYQETSKNDLLKPTGDVVHDITTDNPNTQTPATADTQIKSNPVDGPVVSGDSELVTGNSNSIPDIIVTPPSEADDIDLEERSISDSEETSPISAQPKTLTITVSDTASPERLTASSSARNILPVRSDLAEFEVIDDNNPPIIGYQEVAVPIKFFHQVVLHPVINIMDHNGNIIIYHLYGINLHIGRTVNSGHYFSIIKSLLHDDHFGVWFSFNDDNVRQMTDRDMADIFANNHNDAKAYILFYVRDDEYQRLRRGAND